MPRKCQEHLIYPIYWINLAVDSKLNMYSLTKNSAYKKISL